MRSAFFKSAALIIALPCVSAAIADPVRVRFAEGVVHGLLSLRGPGGEMLASGDLLQTSAGERVTSRLVYHFRDGSISDETAVYSQRGHFQLISDHAVQRGPAFDHPSEMTIDARAGLVTVRYSNDHGEEKVEREEMKLPPDLANGMLPTLLKNIRPAAPPATLSFVAATPKPRLVKLELSVAGHEAVWIAGARRKAIHYVVKVDIGGLSGLVAPLFGKQPPDAHVWILEGEVPAFLRSRAPMTAGGALWQTDLVAPQWSRR